ncbi:MAG: cobalt-precorrin-6A reductase [Geminocystis sp. GBBB08]|nr:cobalt-precorrin-6A reductase [Geminocystis sp. GBBB08]
MIWLIGGTSESVAIASFLKQQNQNLIISVTTTAATQLYQSLEKQKIFVGKLTETEMVKFIKQNQVNKVIDASHPFAVNISQGVIKVCQNLSLPYLRYERPLVDLIGKMPSVTVISSLSSLITEDSPLTNKRVLLTIGAKSLALFTAFHHQATLYARILPYHDSLTKAYQAGFECDRIIAMRPPFNFTFEKALWELWNIEIVVTKAGGKAGGEEIKYQVAEALNIPLIVIESPTLDYPLIVDRLEDISRFICH